MKMSSKQISHQEEEEAMYDLKDNMNWIIEQAQY
jgi:hypothetical protein